MQDETGIDEMARSEERITAARAKLTGEELEKFERAVVVANAIKMILLAVDLAALEKDTHITAAELRVMASEMRKRNGALGAWPFPETLNLADKRNLELDVLDAIAGLISARENWRQKKDEKSFTTGADILQLLGEDRL